MTLTRKQLTDIKAILVWAQGIAERTAEDKLFDTIKDARMAVSREIDFMNVRDKV